MKQTNPHLVAATFDTRLLKSKANLSRQIADILDPQETPDGAQIAAESAPNYGRANSVRRNKKNPPPASGRSEVKK